MQYLLDGRQFGNHVEEHCSNTVEKSIRYLFRVISEWITYVKKLRYRLAISPNRS